MSLSSAAGAMAEARGVNTATVKFTLGDDEVDDGLTNGHDEKPAEKVPKSRSRFQVAKVEFAAEPRAEGQNNKNNVPPDTNGTEVGGVTTQNGQGDGADGGIPAKLAERLQSISVDGSISPPYSPNPTDSYHASYDTTNLKTFGANTLEALPNLDHYRNSSSATGQMRKRPTLRELQQEDDIEEEGQQLLEEIENGKVPSSQIPTEEVKSAAPKFGWIKGVLVRCLLNIYGVMLFLRLSWVVGQSGIGLSALVILLATVVTVITSLSMSAICTNGDVKGGGAYFMISRSLGPEFGGAIGLIFSVANAVAVAMYVVGFAETIRDILESYDCLMVDHINDVRIIGLITVFILLAIALIGMEWEARAQIVLLAILVVAIFNFIIGTFIPASEVKQAKGFYGYKGTIFKDNFGPDFRDGNNFFSVFAIFFPAATGILAGANISGDLEDAQKAIPKGTLLAILISTITYFAMAWMAGSCIVRDALGPISDHLNSTNGTELLDVVVGVVNATMYNVTAADGTQLVCTHVDCHYGLHNDMQAMQLASAFGPLTIAGIISATLSSALASLVSAPKVFQAVCRDKIFPFIHVFAKGYGSGEEPWRAYFLAVAIGATCICIGRLNAIAPLISNFFLMSYALINYSCFDASLAKSPGWRPAFRYYSKWLSLLGALLCLAVMFVINWWTALITFACVSALYVYVHYRKPDINWGSSTQAHVYRNALQHTLKLSHVLDHVKNYRPQLLVLSGFPSDRQILVDFGSNITKNVSLMVCGHVILGDPKVKLKDTTKYTKAAYAWLYKRKSKAFYCGVIAPNLRSGCQALIQCVGTGKLRPNTLLLGFKSDWKTARPEDVEDYYLMINDAFDLRYGVAILRLQGGLDFSHVTKETVKDVPADDEVLPDCTEAMEADSEEEEFAEEPAHEVVRPGDGQGRHTDLSIRKDILQDLNRFHRKQRSGTIDVWWMFDDGGLTILLPYLLTTRTYWQHCRLRVFIAGTKKKDLDRDQRRMATLLSKFRIEYSSMCVIPDINKKPQKQNEEEFDKLLEGQILDPEAGETEETHPWKISEDALEAQKEKTNRHIRLKELMLQHSRDATLIVMTLPIPRKGLCSAGLYMAWLDTLTKDLPPILLLRGNQDSVLTYYS